MTINQWSDFLCKELETTDFENPQKEVELFIQWILDISWSEFILKRNQEFPADKIENLEKHWLRLKSGEPLAYIRGYQDFYKYRFHVSPSVLIPRPETEIIIEKCLEYRATDHLKVMDLGAGSGCIGLSIAKELPHSRVWLFDSSSKALEVVKQNASSLSLNNVEFVEAKVGIQENLKPELLGTIDFVLANPPYIVEGDSRLHWRVEKFEPSLALYGDNNGLEWIHKWLTWSYDYMKPEAQGIFEFGEGQEDEIKALFETQAYRSHEFIKDYSNKWRFVRFKK